MLYFFDYIENYIEQENDFTMNEFTESVNEFLKFNKFQILKNKWSISHSQAENKAFRLLGINIGLLFALL